MNRLLIIFTAILSMSFMSVSSLAATPEKVEAAVADILFEFEVDEVSSYGIDDDGALDVSFPNNMPDDVYGKIVRALKSHKDIESVLPGRGGPACSLF